VIGGLLGGGVRTDVAGVQTLTNGQQIHTCAAPWTHPRYGERTRTYCRKIQCWAEILQQLRESLLQDFL
jgi:hypothetical protein